MLTRKVFQSIWFVPLIVLSLLISACTATTQESMPETGTEVIPEEVAPGSEVGGYAELEDALRAAGASVESGGAVSQEFFEPAGQIIRVNGADVQVFEFADEQVMQAAAGQISPDGSSIGTTMVTWVDEPHFWAAGRTIALYVGSDETVVNLLTQVMGDPVTEN